LSLNKPVINQSSLLVTGEVLTAAVAYHCDES